MTHTTPPNEPQTRSARRSRRLRRVGQAALVAAVAVYGIGGLPTPQQPGPSPAAAQTGDGTGCGSGVHSAGCTVMVHNGGIAPGTDLTTQITPETAQEIGYAQRGTLADRGVEFDFDAYDAAVANEGGNMDRDALARIFCAGLRCGNVDDPGAELIRRGISFGTHDDADGNAVFSGGNAGTIGQTGSLFYRLPSNRAPYIRPYRPTPIVQQLPSVTNVYGSTVDEGAGVAYATLVLSHSSIHSFSASLTVGASICSHLGCWSGTATAGQDYTARTGSITIPAGSSSATVRIPIIDDTEDELEETFMVHFSSNSRNAACNNRPGCGLQGSTYTWGANVTIVDNDAYLYPPPAVSVSGGAKVVEDDHSSANVTVPFVVSLSKATTDHVTVTVNTSDVTATAGSDYTALVDHPVTIRAGNISTRVYVAVIEDVTDEPNETFTLTISDPVDAVLSPFDTATGTILDDDPNGWAAGCGVDSNTGFYRLGVYGFDTSTFSRHAHHISFGIRWADPDGTTVAYTSADITTGVTYTATLVEYYRASGYFGWITASRARWVLGTAECSPGTIAQPDWQVSVSDWTAYEGDGSAHATVSMNRPAPSSNYAGYGLVTPAHVTLDTSDVTAIAGSDYTAASGVRVDFPPGHMQVTVMIPVADDGVIEPDETFTVTISNPAAETVCYGGYGVPPSCSSGTAPVLDVDTATITIVDNDDPEVAIEGPAAAVEGSQVDFKVKLDKTTTADVVVTVSTDAEPWAVDPADAGGRYRDYTPLSGHTARIPAGSLEATVSVSTVGDSVDEFDETFLLRIDSIASTADVQIGADDEAVGTITDDDAEPTVTVAAASSVESSGSVAFTVTLSHVSQKLTNVTATTGAGTAADSPLCAATNGTQDYQSTTSIVRFPRYFTIGVFNVRVCDDTVAELDETFTVTLSSPTRLSLGSPPTATGTILDDDVMPEVSISDAFADENSSITFDLALDVASPRTVTVMVATSASSPLSAAGVTTCTAVDGSDDYQTSTTTVTFAASSTTATFTVTVCDDTAAEGDETFTVTLSSPANATISATAGSAVGTINDNDATPAQRCLALHGPGWAPVLHPDGTPWTDPNGQIICGQPH